MTRSLTRTTLLLEEQVPWPLLLIVFDAPRKEFEQ
jgi:hypothetical protein